MSEHFLQYWEPKQADYELTAEPVLNHSGSGQFKRVGVKPGDTVWIVTVRPPGIISTVGKIHVGEVVNYAEAVRRFGRNVWEAKDHIIADVGTEEELREVDLMDIAAQLRFQSPSGKDSLTLVGGHVKAQQLQAMRKLTAASAALLESKWQAADLPGAPELEQQIKSGGGFGNPETNKKVERAAVECVTAWYQANGWSVQSVEAKRCGYDLRCSKRNIEENVEVKGIRGTGMSFIITEGEVRQAKANPRFVLCVVTSALSSSPKLTQYRGHEFVKKFELNTLAYRASLRS